MTEPDFRPEFVAGLTLLAQACALLRARSKPLPVLVGGAVVEFDTVGAIATGDFDLHAPDDQATRQALLDVGFRREDRPGAVLRGLYHPTMPIGVELVSGAYFDGHAQPERIRIVDVRGGTILMAPTEELIADRLGQWEASGRQDAAMLTQARVLLALAEELDEAYLDRRIRQDTAGAFDLAGLRELEG